MAERQIPSGIKDPFNLALTPFKRYSRNRRPLEECFQIEDKLYERAPETIYRQQTVPKCLRDIPSNQLVLPEEFDAPARLPPLPPPPSGPGISIELKGRWHRKDPNLQEDPFNLHFVPFHRYRCSRTPLDQHLDLLVKPYNSRPTHKPIHFLTTFRNPFDCYLWTSEYIQPQKQEKYRINQYIRMRRCLYDTFFDFNTDGVHEIWPKRGFVGRM